MRNPDYLTAAEFRELSRKARPSKYRAVPTRGADGTRYHSQAEARRARDLRLLAAAGELAELIEQPRYELAPGFLYVADFEVTDQKGNRWAEDVKGFETPVFGKVRQMWPAAGPCPLHILKHGEPPEIIPGRNL